MDRNSLLTGRFALTGVALATLLAMAPSAHALGLGRLSVQSALGESLRAEIDITSITPEESGSLKVRVAPPEAYRAAGVEYNAVLSTAQASLERRGDGRPFLRIASDRTVQDPFVDVILEITWSSGRLVREYTLLLDPVTARAPAPPAPSAPAVIAAAPPAPAAAPAPTPAAPAATAPVAPQAPAARPAPVPAPAPAPAPAARAPAPPSAQAPAAPAPRPPAAAAAPAPAAQGPTEYRVRPGDSLSRIAGRVQRPGVSLDQMLVALYRSNPSAFIDNNMNLLRSGAVLSVPDAGTAGAIDAGEAKQVIQAQSADFGAYRQRLAAGVPPARVDANTRQSSGRVQAAVEDRQPAAATPDKLTLSKGGTDAAKTAAAEAQLSKEREAKENAARVAELSKNVEQLKSLSKAASASANAGSAPSGTTPGGGSPAAASPAPAPAPAPAVVAAAPAPAPTPAAPPAPAPAPAAAAAPAPAPTAPPAPAPTVVAQAPAPVTAAPGGAPDEPGPVGSILDNPLVLPGAGVLVALLAGLGFYRLRSKGKTDSGETSFLESRLQPDSFFGASGGQRIDTRDAGAGTSSSMSYSLSQLDAIGDVDPVAEADVYLAYGRDLQAEEILKEAMRANPERLAVRTKLLEVYSKRRDIKGYELLATQLYALTRGEGEEWARAQEMGLQIDAENPLYQPGGRPEVAPGPDGTEVIEPLGASTMPQSVLPSPSKFEQSMPPPSSTFDVDLDLDLDLGNDRPLAPPTMPESTQPFGPPASQPATASDNTLEFDLAGDTGGAAVATPVKAEPDLDFSFDGLKLDDASQGGASSTQPMDNIGGDSELGGDPMSRKLELADEFRQIGDMEGARDLLQEVIAKADGTLRSKAQTMLDELG